MDSAEHCVLQSRYSTLCVESLLTDLCVLQTRLYLFSMCGVMIVYSCYSDSGYQV